MPKITAPTIAAHRARTRERIMEAVDELIRTQGIDRVSMTDVANSAGITRTALYNYFPDKPALLLAFTEQVNSSFVERYRRELPSGVSAARRLSAFVRLQLEGIMAHPHPPAAELGASLGPDAYQALAAHVAPMQRLLTEILEEGTTAGEFDPLPAEHVARLTLAMVGSQRLPLVNGDIDLDQTHALVTRFALRALGVEAETVDTVLP
ncbi:TetR/AcrR family transcriptional regulator [Nocardiopsis halotolerans]|uniref:TetR/AcrR family transcriptional regulator n=1 Tax=Nocardiopsis halotolerans TaxID=124252 RepID=UPI00034A7FA1|nr:TetR/AcrR family transcriptional regulator [Nocardiopsis halotolerans]